jgi:hypothetical protein
MIPKQELIVVLLEEPDLAYIDETSQAFNLVALVNKSTFNVQSVFKLNKAELANCMIFMGDQ